MMNLIHEKMKDHKIQEFIKNNTDRKAMAMALIFYMGLQDGNTVKREVCFLLRQSIFNS